MNKEQKIKLDDGSITITKNELGEDVIIIKDSQGNRCLSFVPKQIDLNIYGLIIINSFKREDTNAFTTINNVNIESMKDDYEMLENLKDRLGDKQ